MPRRVPQKHLRSSDLKLTQQSPALAIASIKLEANPVLMTRNEVCDSLSIKRSALDQMINRGEFPRGLPYSEHGHVKRWPAAWVVEFKRRKIAAAQAEMTRMVVDLARDEIAAAKGEAA